MEFLPGVVANVVGAVAESRAALKGSPVCCRVGLDSYRCYSLMSVKHAGLLEDRGARVIHLERPIKGTTAGGGTVACATLIELWCELVPPGSSPVSFILRCAVTPLPEDTDMLLSWQDIINHGLQSLLSGWEPNPRVCAVVNTEKGCGKYECDSPAPEETEENFELVSYAVDDDGD